MTGEMATKNDIWVWAGVSLDHRNQAAGMGMTHQRRDPRTTPQSPPLILSRHDEAGAQS